MRVFQSAEGVRWGVEATIPGASNVMIVFHHPDGSTSRNDRYAWRLVTANRRDVVATVDANDVLESLTDADLAALFRRSMLISAADSPLHPPVTHA